MNAALILSGGSGTRMGTEIPKQYLNAGGKPVISYCIETFEASPFIDAVVVVAADEYRELIRSLFLHEEKFAGFADPGENRQLSILSGLNKLSEILKDDDRVIIHDAARPFVSSDTIGQIIKSLDDCEAVLPVLPLKDTVYETDGKNITANLERSRIVAGQAPEGFVFGKYLKANNDLLPEKILNISGSMQPAVMAGMKIAAIDGDENNFKITTPADLARFEEIIRK